MLTQNDDYGKDYYEGFKEGLAKEAGRIVKHVSYETTDPTVDSQIIQLKDSGATVFFNIAIPKFAAQAIRKGRPTSAGSRSSTSTTSRPRSPRP